MTRGPGCPAAATGPSAGEGISAYKLVPEPDRLSAPM